jgi:hypothetical protein
MKRFAISILTVLVLVTLALADNPHFKRGPNLSDNGLTASASGAITGLGNGNIIITLSFPNAVGTTVCKAPGKNGNEAPGQNPALPLDISGSILISNVKNGNVNFSLSTDAPDDPSSEDVGCPNGNWRARFSDVSFGAGTLIVQQETFQGSGVYEVVLSVPVNL